MRVTNRIDHFAWTVRTENLEKYADHLAAVFNTTFEDVTSEKAGVRAMISWDSGIELACPLEGSDEPAANSLRSAIEANGEGPCAVLFRVPNLEAAAAHAASLGWEVDDRIVEPEPGLLSEKLHSAREQYIGSFLGTAWYVGEFDYVEGGNPKS